MIVPLYNGKRTSPFEDMNVPAGDTELSLYR
ncbi:MAG: hypothetical protein CM1200mP22_31420 [Dehalococcoidia bacterium]|nr:MAG: hypothetical protein CM1200mP22_31420 [Dehalococcoidia bacterium]